MTNLGLIVYMAFVLWKTPWGAISLHQCAVEKRARLHSFAFELGACRFSSFLFFIQSRVFCCICSSCCRNFSSCVAIFRFPPPLFPSFLCVFLFGLYDGFWFCKIWSFSGFSWLQFHGRRRRNTAGVGLLRACICQSCIMAATVGERSSSPEITPPRSQDYALALDGKTAIILPSPSDVEETVIPRSNKVLDSPTSRSRVSVKPVSPTSPSRSMFVPERSTGSAPTSPSTVNSELAPLIPNAGGSRSIAIDFLPLSVPSLTASVQSVKRHFLLGSSSASAAKVNFPIAIFLVQECVSSESSVSNFFIRYLDWLGFGALVQKVFQSLLFPLSSSTISNWLGFGAPTKWAFFQTRMSSRRDLMQWVLCMEMEQERRTKLRSPVVESAGLAELLAWIWGGSRYSGPMCMALAALAYTLMGVLVEFFAGFDFLSLFPIFPI